jgi:nucleotide-binding universal stress UspA family protein
MVTSTDSSVPRALHRAVARYHRDLLVVGSSRQGATGRVRIGKRTRQLLGQFDCALAVAPRGAHQRPKLVIHRIGVGYDGGSESEAALDLAASVAIAAGAELEVRTVVDDRIPMLVRPELDPGVAEWEDIVRREVEQARVLAIRAARATGARFGVVVERGRPSDGLLALSGAVDLLVIGSRRWGPAARLLLGSTGEALMHDAACPVLAVPRPTGRHRP